ncbi:MAG: 2-amino-4-hydroxy-6-hydroxymethyldihydropteridine diphosphokinase [Coriobacteriia bacterium]
MRDVFLGLGSNLGDRLGNLARALEAAERLPDTRLLAVSEAVETEPWGLAEQPPFANAVARFASGLSAESLLRALKQIERQLGRTDAQRYGPRVIDIDLLLVGDEEWDTAELTVPHPRLHERAFVLVPLLEIEPSASAPNGSRFEVDAAVQGRVIRRLGPLPGFERLTVRADTGSAPSSVGA